MNLQQVVIADCTGIILMLVLLVSRYFIRRKGNLEDKFFITLVFIALAASLLELTAFLVDGRPGVLFKVLNVASNAFLYGCTTTISLVWLWYVDSNLSRDSKRIKTVFLPYVVVWAALMIALIFNIPFGFFYKIDANNVYSREPIGYIYYGYLGACIITTIAIYAHCRIKHGEMMFFPIWMFLIPIVLSVVVQAIWYGIAVAWLGCAVGLSAIYLNIQSRFSIIDSLTGLYNRSYIEHKLLVARAKSKKYKFAGIMLDIDFFKEINDTFGHSVGDDALREVAKILLKTTERNTLIFRFAGDEFVILIKTLKDEEELMKSQIKDIENAIRQGAKDFNESSEAPYSLQFSIGHAIFDSTLPDDEFFRQMDLEMYKEKKKHHTENR